MTDEMGNQYSTPPPIICVNDRVLLHYAVLNDTVGYNAGHGLMFVGEKEIGKVVAWPSAMIRSLRNSRFIIAIAIGAISEAEVTIPLLLPNGERSESIRGLRAVGGRHSLLKKMPTAI